MSAFANKSFVWENDVYEQIRKKLVEAFVNTAREVFVLALLK